MISPGYVIGDAGWQALRDPRFLWYSFAIVAVLLLAAFIIWLVDRWRKRSAQTHPSSGNLLTHFRKLYEEGELSAEEFTCIRAKLSDKLIKELGKPAAPAHPETPEPDPPPPGEPAS
jgi:hypothetical protein